jgi:hypothetical protein
VFAQRRTLASPDRALTALHRDVADDDATRSIA